MINKYILSQAEIDALLSPLEATEDDVTAFKSEEQFKISTVIKSSDRSLPCNKGDFIPFTENLFDVLVNGRLVAQGEMIAIKDKLGIRLTEIVDKNLKDTIE